MPASPLPAVLNPDRPPPLPPLHIEHHYPPNYPAANPQKYQPQKSFENTQQASQKPPPTKKIDSKSEEIENTRNEEFIESESIKIVRTELKEIVRKDLLKKLIEQFSFKLIDDWEKQAPVPVPGI